MAVYENRELFSKRFLDDLLRKRAEWSACEAAALSAREQLRALLARERKALSSSKESQAEDRWIRPVFKVLGLSFEVQPPLPTDHPSSTLAPDYALFDSEVALNTARELRIQGRPFDYFRRVQMLGDTKRWGTDFQAASKGKFSPRQQLTQYLHLSGVDWGFLTDGQRWRLVHRSVAGRLDRYYEVDLFAALESHQLDDFRFFWLFFSADALRAGPSGEPHFLDAALAESARYSRKVGEELTESVYEALRLLGRGFITRAETQKIDRDLLQRECLTLLYRLLFIFYAEHRRLLPLDDERYAPYSLSRLTHDVAKALDTGSTFPARRTALWSRLSTLFETIDRGDEELAVPAYNGGLFNAKEHALLAQSGPGDRDLALALDLLARTHSPGSAERHFIDYRDLDIRHLGGIYERLLEYRLEIADTELAIVDGDGKKHKRAQRYEPLEPGKHSDLPPSRRIPAGDTYLVTNRGERHASGSFYTPDFVVQYLVADTLEPLVQGKSPEEILKLRVVDTAMGSGHFLLEAVDFLARAYANARVESGENDDAPGKGDEALLDCRRLIAERCIYGVDLNPMAVELAKLALWLKTMAKDHALTFLNHNLKAGNSVIATQQLADQKHFFHWELMFPEVFYDKQGQRRADAGFDAIIGNPPWVRQETLKDDKTALKALYPEVHAGAADIYVYFTAAALRVLAPQGWMGLVLPNKWFRADYAEKMRTYLGRACRPATLIDFGHADIFPDTDTFPCLLIASHERKGKGALYSCPVVERERQSLGESFNLRAYLRERGYPVDHQMLRAEGWYPHSPEVAKLIRKLWEQPRLKEALGKTPYNGIKTGFNQAFLVDHATREHLVAEEPSCAPLLRKFLRGEDIERWSPRWDGQWLIALSSSENREWPWSDAGTAAEQIFQRTYPILYRHMKRHEQKLRTRQDKGRFWWELRSCDYYEQFDGPKLVYQEIQFLSQFALDSEGVYLNNKAFFIPGKNFALAAALNSSLMWWYLWFTAPHMKDDAFALQSYYIERIPLAEVPEHHARELHELARTRHAHEAEFIDWLRLGTGVTRISGKLSEFWRLNEAQFLQELKHLGASLVPKRLKEVRDEFEQAKMKYLPYVEHTRELEVALHESAFTAYGLTARERELVRRTVPPRDPLLVVAASDG